MVPNYCTTLFIEDQMRDSVFHPVISFRASFTGSFFTRGEMQLYDTHSVNLAYQFGGQCERARTHRVEYERERVLRIRAFKQKLEMNKLDLRTNRCEGFSAHAIRMHRSILKCLGAEVNSYQSGNSDASDVIIVLNEVTSRLRRKILGKLKLTFDDFEYFHSCPDCDEVFHEDDGSYRDDEERVCESCINDHYVRSSCMDTYVHNDDYYYVYSSARNFDRGSNDDICTESYGYDHFYEYDGAFFYDRYERNMARGDDDEDDEDYEDHTHGLNSWHNTCRHFIERNVDGKYPPIGMELEVYCENRSEIVETLRSDFSEWNMILERDGSISNRYGFEIITQPMGWTEWQELVPDLTKALIDSDTVGYNEPAGDGYGIHLTMHRHHFSPLAEARISMFLASSENKDFVRAVAQRNQIYSPHVPMADLKIQKVSDISNGNRTNYSSPNPRIKIAGKGKYCPVNWKNDLAEFRIFQSTVNPSSIMKNIEFVWALQRWTADSTGSSFHHVDFLKWLNQPARRHEFPQLVAFLSKRKFYGTNFLSFQSGWKHLMVKPIHESAVEPFNT